MSGIVDWDAEQERRARYQALSPEQKEMARAYIVGVVMVSSLDWFEKALEYARDHAK